MLSVYIDSGPDDRHLALTLSALVSGSVEGVVRNVTVVDRGMSAEAHAVCDHCGCRVLAPSGLEAALGNDRSDWVLWVETGSRLLEGWTSEVIEHIGAGNGPRGGPQAARFRSAARDRIGFLARLAEKRTALTDGLLLKTSQAIGLVRQRGAAPLAELAAGLAAKRLRAEIRPRRAAD
ncbi:glycosyl transferase family 2 [Fulvimarina sp. 2208YS6-2-32]|uniref:Glycosyl transferase family 2 n=1 Tax=Fulvimarina uroteuthidis TaxID=3098149 RepID=A0ABU5HY78_9HYPH|nr:glycosyl transferase family 2 [Fulvimarina sp. 2208YS6-2-32]MDY8107921.1 glycosyl transferase family 2 [Fulvimarina sp. 2208YS6-2-32]